MDNINTNIGMERVRPVYTELGEAEKKMIEEVKMQTANLIVIAELSKTKDPRLASIAQTTYEEACMWLVKAISTAKKENNENQAS